MNLSQLPDLVGFPKLVVVLGRRGSGKSNAGRIMARYWAAPDGKPDRVLLIDRGTFHAGTSTRADVVVPEPPPLDEIIGRYSLVVVDEAHRWLDRQRVPDPTLIELVRTGRHAGLTLVLMSQRPASLSVEARELADKVFLFSLTGRNDLRWVKELDTELEPHLDTLRHQKPGEFLLWDGDDFEHRVKVGVMPLDTPDAQKRKRFWMF